MYRYPTRTPHSEGGTLQACGVSYAHRNPCNPVVSHIHSSLLHPDSVAIHTALPCSPTVGYYTALPCNTKVHSPDFQRRLARLPAENRDAYGAYSVHDTWYQKCGVGDHVVHSTDTAQRHCATDACRGNCHDLVLQHHEVGGWGSDVWGCPANARFRLCRS